MKDTKIISFNQYKEKEKINYIIQNSAKEKNKIFPTLSLYSEDFSVLNKIKASIPRKNICFINDNLFLFLEYLENNTPTIIILYVDQVNRNNILRVVWLIRKRYTSEQVAILIVFDDMSQEQYNDFFNLGINDFIHFSRIQQELPVRINYLMERKENFQKCIDFETTWFHSQTNSHFIFNTLNTILSLQESSDSRRDDLLESFTSLMRAKLEYSIKQQPIDLEQEIQLLKKYISIEQLRYKDKFNVSWKIKGNYHKYKIIPLSLLIIFENALIHGIIKTSRIGNVHILLEENNHYLKIEIKDDGVGTSLTNNEILGPFSSKRPTGVSLKKIHSKMLSHFGSGLEIESIPNKGTIVRMYLKTN